MLVADPVLVVRPFKTVSGPVVAVGSNRPLTDSVESVKPRI